MEEANAILLEDTRQIEVKVAISNELTRTDGKENEGSSGVVF